MECDLLVEIGAIMLAGFGLTLTAVSIWIWAIVAERR